MRDRWKKCPRFLDDVVQYILTINFKNISKVLV